MSKKILYFGGGGSRGPGTMESMIHHGPGGADFDNCEIVIFDVDHEHLQLVVALANKMAREAGRRNMTIRAASSLEDGLRDCNFVLTSFRPGGFEMRAIDERIPLNHGLIGNETEGAGGFMMALRSVHVLKDLTEKMKVLCPGALLVNYTNPVAIVTQALALHSGVQVVSLCEGSIASAPTFPRLVGLEESALEADMVGVNHGTWSVKHRYRTPHGDQDFMPILAEAYGKSKGAIRSPFDRGLIELALRMGSLPNYYYWYYFDTERWLGVMRSKATTRAEDLMRELPGIWEHYRAQLAAVPTKLDPNRSRGGIHELELALDLIAAMIHNRRQKIMVNVLNNGAIPQLATNLAVELPAMVDASGILPLPFTAEGKDAYPDGFVLPRSVMPILSWRAAFQMLAAQAAWSGTRTDAIWAMSAHPLVDEEQAEALYDEMSAAQAQYLPPRLLKRS